ncbi:DNA-3-methyladenine glycosylase [Streptomyces drozdowiczii]
MTARTTCLLLVVALPMLLERRTCLRSHLRMWLCMNLVRSRGPGEWGLLRAGEIFEGAELTRKRRLSARNDKELAKGPARLATALDIGRALDGTDAISHAGADLCVLRGTPPPRDQVRNGPRTGVGGDGAVHPWRFWIDGDPTVSPYRAHVPRRRST